MEIKIKNLENTYRLNIRYYYRYNGEITNREFDSMTSFEEFMMECHPDVDYDEVGTKFAKRMEVLNKLAGKGAYEPKYTYGCVGCFISNGMLISCLSEAGIREKMEEHWKTSEKVNDGYLHTFLAQNWQFDQLASGIMKIYYWYDNNNKDVPNYKIHAFKDKVVFEQANGTIHSIVVSDKYYIYYNGKKRD